MASGPRLISDCDGVGKASTTPGTASWRWRCTCGESRGAQHTWEAEAEGY
ncbi:hypothetical protein ERO13_D04G113751v2 [Gossypium hirsutum]|nr:hypothetical protein ERO13_D04G113751v2 [Gossypium hirsutum]